LSRPVSVLSLTLLCVSGPEGALGPNMKPHSTCSKAVFATLVGCPTGRFTFPWPRAEEGGAHGSVARARASGSSLSSVKGKHVRKQLALLSIGALAAWMYSRLD